MILVFIELHSPSVESTTSRGVHNTWVNFEGQVTSEEVWSESQGAQLEQWSVDLHAASDKHKPSVWGMGVDPEDGVGRVSVAVDPVVFQRLLFAREDDLATLVLRFDDPVDENNEPVFSLDDDKLTWHDKVGVSAEPDFLSIQVHPGGLNVDDGEEEEEEG